MISRRLLNEEDEKYIEHELDQMIRPSRKALHSLEIFLDEDEDSECTRMLKPFSSIFNFIWPRLPEEFKKEVSMGRMSADPLSKVKIIQYLQESLYHDMIHLVGRASGKYPLVKPDLCFGQASQRIHQRKQHSRFSQIPVHHRRLWTSSLTFWYTFRARMAWIATTCPGLICTSIDVASSWHSLSSLSLYLAKTRGSKRVFLQSWGWKWVAAP